MELMQLAMFVAVVEEKSIYRAAHRVLRTQPAVSIALGKLEKEIGTPLLDRSRLRDYRPTTAGEILYEYASRMMALRDEVMSLLRDGDRTSQDQLRAGVTSVTNLIWISAVIARFYDAYPLARLQVACMSISNLAADMDNSKLDFALFPTRPRELEQSDRFAVVPLPSLTPHVWLVHRRESKSTVCDAFREALIYSARI
jgi:DNA-binding transcriptional LysR family regulator